VKCIKDFGVQIEDQDIISLFKSMDTDNSGEISFDEFLRTYVGDMNAFRVSLVEKAYKTMDFNNDG
jgi:Ca2+-binding EF-hand superfamily protein